MTQGDFFASGEVLGYVLAAALVGLVAVATAKVFKHWWRGAR